MKINKYIRNIINKLFIQISYPTCQHIILFFHINNHKNPYYTIIVNYLLSTKNNFYFVFATRKIESF